MKLSNKFASILLILLFSPCISFSQIDPIFKNISGNELKIIGVTTNPKINPNFSSSKDIEVSITKIKSNKYKVCYVTPSHMNAFFETVPGKYICYVGKLKKITGFLDAWYPHNNSIDGYIIIGNPFNKINNFKNLFVPNYIDQNRANKFLKLANNFYNDDAYMDLKKFNSDLKEIFPSFKHKPSNYVNNIFCTYQCLKLYKSHLQFNGSHSLPILIKDTKSDFFIKNSVLPNYLRADLSEKKQNEIKESSPLVTKIEDTKKENLKKSTIVSNNIEKKSHKKQQNLNKSSLSKKQLKEELEYWKDLLDEGLISQNDYESKKDSLINTLQIEERINETNETQDKLDLLVKLGQERLDLANKEYLQQKKRYEEYEKKKRSAANYNLIMQGLGLIANSGPQMNNSYNFNNPFSPPKPPPIVDMTCKFGCIDLGFPSSNCSKMCSK